MTEQNYDTCRKLFKMANPSMTEPEIYENWTKLTYGESCNPQTKPFKGEDGKYHYVYITTFDDGSYYLGKHSSIDFKNDEYCGSGVELVEKSNIPHCTIPLEFFRSANMAFEAERMLVNRRVIDETNEKTVLNKTTGGKASSYSRSGSGLWTFKRLRIPIGDELEMIDDSSVVCNVANTDCLVKYGMGYTGLTKLYKRFHNNKYVKNPLDFWRHRKSGKLLCEIRDEIIRSMQKS